MIFYIQLKMLYINIKTRKQLKIYVTKTAKSVIMFTESNMTQEGLA